MPWNRIADQQIRLYTVIRKNTTQTTSSAKPSFSECTLSRIAINKKAALAALHHTTADFR